MSVGRPKGGIWEYFRFDEKQGYSVCMVPRTDDDSLCSKTMKGKYTTNLKLHLKKEHTEEYMLLIKEEEKKKKEKKTDSPKKSKRKSAGVYRPSPLKINLTAIEVQNMVHRVQNDKQRFITKKLAMFVGTSNVALSLIENVEFRELIHELDPQYQVPDRFEIDKELDAIYSKLKTDLAKSLNSAEKISLCANIWSRKGTSVSFLVITAHFYDREQTEKCNMTIAVRRFESPHTAERMSRLVDTIIDEWKIPHHKIFRMLIDDGSEMVAAFKRDLQLYNDEELNIDASDLETINTTDEMAEDTAEDALRQKQQGQTTSNYEVCEMQHQISLAAYQCMSCFIHTLQHVVHAYDTSSHLRSTLTTAHKLVSKINTSAQATKLLISKKLVSFCPTRWSSTFLMISWLLEMKSSVVSVCEELGWESMSSYQWKELESVEQLLKPFAQYTGLTTGEGNTIGISLVIPVLLELEMHLEDEVGSQAICSIIQRLRQVLQEEIRKYLSKIERKCNTTMTVAKKMLEDLKRRFGYATDPNDVKFDPVFVTATFLNPAYKALLEDAQISAAVEYLKQVCRPSDYGTQSSLVSGDDATYATDIDYEVEAEETEPPNKRPKLLSRVVLLLKEKHQDKAKSTSGTLSLEIERYNQEKFNVELDDDPLYFWTTTNDFPSMTSVACHILCIPSSTDPAERGFPLSAESASSKLNDYNLEREVLLQKNRDKITF